MRVKISHFYSYKGKKKGLSKLCGIGLELELLVNTQYLIYIYKVSQRHTHVFPSYAC